MYGAYFCNTVMPDGEVVTEPNQYEWCDRNSLPQLPQPALARLRNRDAQSHLS
jgi:hypothetical protein